MNRSLCFIAFFLISIANATELTDFRHNYKKGERTTRIVLVFDQAADYRDLVRGNQIEIILENSKIPSSVNFTVSKDDPILKQIQTVSSGDGNESIILTLNYSVESKIFSLRQPDRLVIDLIASGVATQPKTEVKTQPQPQIEKTPVQRDTPTTQKDRSNKTKSNKGYFTDSQKFIKKSLDQDESQAEDDSEDFMHESKEIGTPPPIESKELIVGMVEETDDNIPIPPKPAWLKMLDSLREFWSYIRVAIDILLVLAILKLGMQIAKNQRLIRDITFQQVNVPTDQLQKQAVTHETPQPQEIDEEISDPEDFDQILDEEMIDTDLEFTSEIEDDFIESLEKGPMDSVIEDEEMEIEQIKAQFEELLLAEEDKEDYTDEQARVEASEILKGDEILDHPDRSMGAVIRKLKDRGFEDAQIAHQLNITHEEVALMLTLGGEEAA